MTVQQIIDELNDHGFSGTSVTRKVAFINDTVWDILAREPWPFLEKSTTLNFSGSSGAPSNWSSITDFKAVLDIVNTTTGQVLTPLRLDVFDKKNALNLTQAGDAINYYFLAGQLNVWPVPSAGTAVLQMRYLAHQPALVSTDVEATILLPPQHHRLIVLGALVKLYDMEDDPELAARMEAHFERRLQTARSDLWMRQYDRPDQIHVIGHDDYDIDYYL